MNGGSATPTEKFVQKAGNRVLPASVESEDRADRVKRETIDFLRPPLDFSTGE